MLKDEIGTVNADDPAAGVGLGDGSQGGFVAGIIVSGHQYGSVHNEEVGVGSRQAMPVGCMFGVRPRQGKQAIRGPGGSTQGLEFLDHGSDGGIVLVIGIVARYMDNGVVRGKACEHVHMPVGIIAREIAMIEPKYTFGTKKLVEGVFDIGQGHVRVSVWIGEAGAGGQDGAVPIAFDAAAFKDKVDMAQVGGAKNTMVPELAGDEVVEIGAELAAPSIELEVEQDRMVVFADGNGTEVASPRVVGGDGGKGDPVQAGLGLVEEPACFVRGVGDEDDASMVAGVGNDGGEGFLDLGEKGFPVCGFMGPGHEDAVLFLPFGR